MYFVNPQLETILIDPDDNYWTKTLFNHVSDLERLKLRAPCVYNKVILIGYTPDVTPSQFESKLTPGWTRTRKYDGIRVRLSKVDSGKMAVIQPKSDTLAGIINIPDYLIEYLNKYIYIDAEAVVLHKQNHTYTQRMLGTGLNKLWYYPIQSDTREMLAVHTEIIENEFIEGYVYHWPNGHMVKYKYYTTIDVEPIQIYEKSGSKYVEFTYNNAIYTARCVNEFKGKVTVRLNIDNLPEELYVY